MKDLYYADADIPEGPSMFLAGPSPRSSEVPSWRPDALKILSQKGFQGSVFIPEMKEEMYGEKERVHHLNDSKTIQWEEDQLKAATVIVFWIPRNVDTMPALTTNIEWGKWEDSGKVVLGYPEDAPSMTYIRHYADKYDVPVAHTLEDTLGFALEMIASK